MKVKLTESVTARLTHECLSYAPRFTLSGPYVTIAGYDGPLQRESEISTTFGSLQWLWSEDDEIRFRRTTGELHSALLHLPEKWSFASHSVAGWAEAPITHGGLRVDVEEAFSLPQAHEQWCEENARHLICLRYPQPPSEGERFRLRFARDTDLLFSDGYCVGWMLTDPARYLTSGWESGGPSDPEDITRTLLGACLRLTASPVVEEIMDGDDSAWRRLRRVEESLCDLAHDERRASVLLSVVRRLIDEYR